MKVRCRNFKTSTGENERFMGNGNGYWGTYGAWSDSCLANTAVCGIRTKIEKPQGRADDTALNDVELYCCGEGMDTINVPKNRLPPPRPFLGILEPEFGPKFGDIRRKAAPHEMDLNPNDLL